METAKVDIRKLQLLNDRINQCIDALSQVRLSVHGLTSAPNTGLGIGAGLGQGPVGLSHTGAFGNPFAAQGIGGMMNPGIPQAFGANPFAQQFGGVPYGQGTSPFGQLPIAQHPFLQSVTPGLSHTTGAWGPAAFAQGVNPYAGISGFGGEGLEAYGRTGGVDPLLTARITQTFPYAQFPAPPVISLY
jgi:hypothetical protein